MVCAGAAGMTTANESICCLDCNPAQRYRVVLLLSCLVQTSACVMHIVSCVLASLTFRVWFVPCQAFKVVTWLQRTAVAGMAIAALLAAAAICAGQSSPAVWAFVWVGAAAAALAAWKLGQVRQKFIFVDYVQADH